MVTASSLQKIFQRQDSQVFEILYCLYLQSLDAINDLLEILEIVKPHLFSGEVRKMSAPDVPSVLSPQTAVDEEITSVFQNSAHLVEKFVQVEVMDGVECEDAVHGAVFQWQHAVDRSLRMEVADLVSAQVALELPQHIVAGVNAEELQYVPQVLQKLDIISAASAADVRSKDLLHVPDLLLYKKNGFRVCGPDR